jgi:arsenical pump membrane protein
MPDVAAFSILALTVSLSLSRPAFGPIRIHHSTAAIIGAVLTLGLGLVPIDMVWVAARILFFPVVTIVSLMIITLIADRAGLFEVVARTIAHLGKGDGRKLFAYLFFAGTLTGTVFTNDAAVLIFTPLVVELIDDVQGRSWAVENKVPY